MWLVYMKLLTLLLLSGAAFGQNAREPDIQVISANSSWRRDGRSVARRDLLSAISNITGTDHATGLILDCHHKGWLAYSCPKSCTIPVCADKIRDVLIERVNLGDRPEEKNWLTALLQAFFSREPADVESLGVRAGGALITDAVILQDSRGEHWGPALPGVVDGMRCFQIHGLPRGSGGAATVFVDWQHTDASGVAPLSGLHPGLYEMEIGAVSSPGVCQRTERPATAWVLMVTPTDFRRINADWMQRSSFFKTLARKADPDAASTMRHALLAYWADNLGKR